MKTTAEEKAEILDSIEKFGILAQGKNEYIKYLKGGRLTQKGQILAQCYACMGYYSDGKEDCEVHVCPLYPSMPYNPHKSSSKVISDEQMERMKKPRKKAEQGIYPTE
jgi:hypothetical protein